jgi:putative FmdB family regulatory protein
MPIYEYACGSCDHHLDAFQSMQDAPLLQCEQCGKPSLVKLVSAAGFRLKGSGWYETDFKNDGDKKKNLVTSDTSASSAPTEKSSVANKPDKSEKVE